MGYKGKFKKGDKFGKWTVMDSELEYNDKSEAKVRVQCECGATKTIHAAHLLKEKSKSCGCALTARTGSNNPNFRGSGVVGATTVNYVNLTNSTNFTANKLSDLASSQSFQCYYSGNPIANACGINGTITTTSPMPATMDSSPVTITATPIWVTGNNLTTGHLTSLPTQYSITWGQQHYAWADPEIARMKGDLTPERFIELCHQVAERHPRPDPAPKGNSVIEAAKQIAKKYK